MKYSRVEPHAFLLQVLTQCSLGSHLTTIGKRQILLSVMKDNVGFFSRTVFLELIENGRRNHSGYKIWRHSELHQSGSFVVKSDIAILFLVYFLPGLLVVAVRAAAMCVSHKMPFARRTGARHNFCRIGRVDIERLVIVAASAGSVRQSEYNSFDACIRIILFKVEHVGVIGHRCVIFPCLHIHLCYRYKLTACATSAKLKHRNL